MALTSRELVHHTLEFKNPPRVPRELWVSLAAQTNHPDTVKTLQQHFSSDFSGVGDYLRKPIRTSGQRQEIGKFVDEWGCIFENIQWGVMGEIKDPLIKNWTADIDRVHIPLEYLTAAGQRGPGRFLLGIRKATRDNPVLR